ncbi:SseB family protein [Streptoalloteichus hindustanus]|uniref:Uncharacterized protein n=1 Tax=Streptoalloteichus hindustanus TaxID=2017 RepID=A0A1M4TJ59_STRHI|nr:SseB family protein [Streptoalloteichus hindustanus]SHE44523.1 hypothetical protein SAMN05444320_101103 [Streptoalloteichus hindustanus]
MRELHIFDYLAKSPLPPVTEEAIEYARHHPGQWLSYVDPHLFPGAPVTTSFVLGARQIDDEGRLTDEIWINSNFIPQQPKTAGMTFANHFELVFWRAMTGYSNIDQFLNALQKATLITPGSPGAADRLWFDDEPNGDRVLPVYSSPQFLPPDRYPWRSISGLEILEKACPQESSVIHFNPNGNLSAGFAGSDMSRWWAEWKKFDAMAKERFQAEQGTSSTQGPAPEPR